MTAGTTSNRGHCTGNVLSERPTRWAYLCVLQRQIFPGVPFDEARPGLPASVDGQSITFVTASSTPASTPVEVCGLSCSRTPFACPHRWTLLSHITRRKTTSVASAGLSRLRQASVPSISLSTGLRTGGGERFLLCSFLSPITRTGGPLLFLLRVFLQPTTRDSPHQRFLSAYHDDGKLSCPPQDRGGRSHLLRRRHPSHRAIAPAGVTLRLRCNGSYEGEDHCSAISVFLPLNYDQFSVLNNGVERINSYNGSLRRNNDAASAATNDDIYNPAASAALNGEFPLTTLHRQL